MVTCKALIEYLPNEIEAQAITIDLSHNIERFGVLLNALEDRLIRTIVINDESNNTYIRLQLGNAGIYISETHELKMPLEQVSLLKSMICNAVIGNSFHGYHLDLDISSNNNTIELCIVLL